MLNYFNMDEDIFDEKFAFSFCAEAIFKQTHGQTHCLVHVSLILIIYFNVVFQPIPYKS